MAQIDRIGFGQVEPNHLSAQRTGQIYAQLPAATAITTLENGQFAKYDYATGEVNYTGAGEYDANGNYVGPKPTQESLDAASENTDTTDTEDTGSDTQSGDYSDGYSEDNSQEYDSSYSGDYSDYSDGYSDSYNEDYSDSYSDGYNGDYYSEDYGY